MRQGDGRGRPASRRPMQNPRMYANRLTLLLLASAASSLTVAAPQESAEARAARWELDLRARATCIAEKASHQAKEVIAAAFYSPAVPASPDTTPGETISRAREALDELFLHCRDLAQEKSNARIFHSVKSAGKVAARMAEHPEFAPYVARAIAAQTRAQNALAQKEAEKEAAARAKSSWAVK